MKKIYWNLLVLLVAVWTGCNSEQEFYTVDTVKDGMQLSVSKDTVSLSQENLDEPAVTFTWSPAQERKNNGTITYYFKIGLASDDMATAIDKIELTKDLYQYVDGVYRYSISNWDLNEIIHNLGLNYGVTAELKAEIIAYSDGDYYVMPEVSTVGVMVNSFKLAAVNLYLVGTANLYGSELSNGIKLTEIVANKDFGNEYEWEGYLQAGTFKFVNSLTEAKGSWSMGATSTTLVENATSSSSDTEFLVTQNGWYSISLNKSEGTISYEYKELTQAFKGPHTLSAATPCEILAADFDIGGEGYAFHDSNTDNSTGNDDYRRNNGDSNSYAVDVKGDGVNVGWIEPSEWLVYTVEVEDAGNYVFEMSESAAADGLFHLEVDGIDRTGSIDVPNNGSWGDWRWLAVTSPINFTAGEHKVKVYIDKSGYNLRAFRFTWQAAE